VLDLAFRGRGRQIRWETRQSGFASSSAAAAAPAPGGCGSTARPETLGRRSHEAALLNCEEEKTCEKRLAVILLRNALSA
jgi:hypothetical protein